MNDSDPEEDDIDLSKRIELFKCIEAFHKESGNEEADNRMSLEHLNPVKGFKEYKLSLEREETKLMIDKKQQGSKLKPLKFQEFRARGMTEKRIKNNAELILDNNSLTTDREMARMFRTKN